MAMSGGSKASSLNCGVVGVRDDRASEIESRRVFGRKKKRCGVLDRDKGSRIAARARREKDARSKRVRRARLSRALAAIAMAKRGAPSSRGRPLTGAERTRLYRARMSEKKRKTARKRNAAAMRARYVAADACQHQNVLAPVKMEADYDNYDNQQKESQSQSKDGLVARSDVGSLAPATLEPGSVLMTAETYCALLIRRGFTPLVSGERCPRVEGIAATV